MRAQWGGVHGYNLLLLRIQCFRDVSIILVLSAHVAPTICVCVCSVCMLPSGAEHKCEKGSGEPSVFVLMTLGESSRHLPDFVPHFFFQSGHPKGGKGAGYENKNLNIHLSFLSKRYPFVCMPYRPEVTIPNFFFF